MREMALLELKKNRLLFAAFVGLFLFSVPFSGAVALWAELSFSNGTNAAFAFWTVLGLPLAAVFFGAASGAANATEPLRSAEEPLPVSPWQKAAGAACGNAAYVLLLALLALSAAFVGSAAWREAFVTGARQVADWGRSEESLFLRAFHWQVLAMLPYLLAGSFALAHWLRHGILGGMLGALLGGLALAACAAGLLLEALFEYRAPFVWKAAVAALAALAGALWGLKKTADWSERRLNRKWPSAALAAAALAAGAAVSGGALAWSHGRLLRSVLFLTPPSFYLPWEGWLATARLYRQSIEPQEEPRQDSVLLAALDGSISRVYSDGRRRTLIEGRRNLARWTRTPLWLDVESVEEGPDGTLWMLVSDRDTTELWQGPPDGPLALWSRWPRTSFLSLVAGGKRPVLLSRSFETSHGEKKPRVSFRYAPLPEPSRTPEWRDIGEGPPTSWREEWVRGGFAARLSHEGRALTQRKEGRGLSWSLPGRAVQSGRVEGLAPRFQLVPRPDESR